MTIRIAVIAAASGLLLMAGGAASSPGLQVAGLNEILAGAKSCAAATTAAGVNAAALEADGWHKATVSDNGKSVDAPMTFYGKGRLLLMFDKSGTHPICFVTARISSKADYTKLQAAFVSSYGSPVEDKGKGEQIFMAPDHRMYDLAPTGTATQPAVRIVVGAIHQEAQ